MSWALVAFHPLRSAKQAAETVACIGLAIGFSVVLAALNVGEP